MTFWCKNCKAEFGRGVHCDCSRSWCSHICAGEHKYSYKEVFGERVSSCKWCRKEDVPDSVLLEFILKKIRKSREEVIQKYWREVE